MHNDTLRGSGAALREIIAHENNKLCSINIKADVPPVVDRRQSVVVARMYSPKRARVEGGGPPELRDDVEVLYRFQMFSAADQVYPDARHVSALCSHRTEEIGL